jgi:hypothetical protein
LPQKGSLAGFGGGGLYLKEKSTIPLTIGTETENPLKQERIAQNSSGYFSRKATVVQIFCFPSRIFAVFHIG